MILVTFSHFISIRKQYLKLANFFCKVWHWCEFSDSTLDVYLWRDSSSLHLWDLSIPWLESAFHQSQPLNKRHLKAHLKFAKKLDKPSDGYSETNKADVISDVEMVQNRCLQHKSPVKFIIQGWFQHISHGITSTNEDNNGIEQDVIIFI